VAARVAWSGCGAVVPLKRASAARLRSAIDRVWGNPTYQQNAQRLQQAIATAGAVALQILTRVNKAARRRPYGRRYGANRCRPNEHLDS
jgi:UDP:flavonoid glycosyltransferase YjiC (YdhE family)